MKLKKIYSLLFLSVAFAACDDYLSTLPDNRTELDTADKVKSLMSSAYSVGNPAIIAELSSDNFIDNGKSLGSLDRMHDELFAWQASTASLSTNDSPGQYWNYTYNAIAHANHALQAIDKLEEQEGTSDLLKGLRVEALLCRAYGHFSLANLFCLPYVHGAANDAQGIPYATEPETTVSPDYQRGTLAETYEKIKKDIDDAFEIGVGYLDGVHTVAKYHFDSKSANALAAQFYLYYGDYEKVISFANTVLGTNPVAMMRDYTTIELDEVEYIGNWYVKTSQACNLMLQAYNSAFFRVYGTRYGHGGTASAGCLRGGGPNWSDFPPFSKNFYIRNIEYGVIFPKQIEFFEYTDKVAGIGFVHTVVPVFTAERVLLDRAEAYVHTHQLGKALEDLALWTSTHKVSAALSDAQIKKFYVEGNRYFYNKFHYNVSDLNDEESTYLQCVLHFRRCETVYEGTRWSDLKRYGINISHTFDKKVTEELTYDDPRRAIQIPADVVAADLPGNPRPTATAAGSGTSTSDFVLVK